MKICLRCECIYPDYHVECPVCKEANYKEWKKSDRVFYPTINRETIIDKSREKVDVVVEYHYNDLKDFIEE